MSTRVTLPDAADPTSLIPLIPDLDPTVTPGPPSMRRRRARPVSGPSLRAFAAIMGGMIGCTTGVLLRGAIAAAGLEGALPPATLGVVGGVGGLSLAFIFGRLMDLARCGTIRVEIDGEKVRLPLRRRDEVVRRASQYLAGLAASFVTLLATARYALGEAFPATRAATLTFSPDLQVVGLVAAAAAAVLALGEWVVRLVRKEGHAELGVFLLVPAMAALGLTLSAL